MNSTAVLGFLTKTRIKTYLPQQWQWFKTELTVVSWRIVTSISKNVSTSKQITSIIAITGLNSISTTQKKTAVFVVYFWYVLMNIQSLLVDAVLSSSAFISSKDFVKLANSFVECVSASLTQLLIKNVILKMEKKKETMSTSFSYQ